MLSFTIAVLILGAAIGVADKVLRLGDQKWGRRIFLVLYIASLGVAGYSAHRQEQSSRERHATLEAELAATREKLVRVESVTVVTNAFVGDLAKLSALGGARTYYVRIAADTSRDRLN